MTSRWNGSVFQLHQCRLLKVGRRKKLWGGGQPIQRVFLFCQAAKDGGDDEPLKVSGAAAAQLNKAEVRKQQRAERQKKWDELMAAKPDEKYEDPQVWMPRGAMNARARRDAAAIPRGQRLAEGSAKLTVHLHTLRAHARKHGSTESRNPTGRGGDRVGGEAHGRLQAQERRELRGARAPADQR